MRKISILTAVALLAVCAVPSFAAEAKAREGKWQVTTSLEMPGMPAMKPMTMTHCVTKEDAADPQKSLPKPSRDGQCKIGDYKVDGGKVTWTMTCEGKQKMTGKGEMQYKQDAYDGSMTITMEGGQEMKMSFSGKRLGDCD